MANDQILMTSSPAMFRNRPATFTLLLIVWLVGLSMAMWASDRRPGQIALGVASLIFVIWYLQACCTKIIITTKATILRRGILSKYTTEVRHKDVREVQISQRFFERLVGVGGLAIGSAGTSGMEIVVAGIRDPQKLKTLIDQQR